MQKKKQNKNNTVKQIILYILLVVIIILLTFAEDIIKLANKNKINLAENSERELIINEPNPPQLSAGMIPVKWNGTNWIITTAKDNDWYDYKNGKPAYIMLNDGYYQSELIRDMSNKELAENNVGVGVPDDPSIRGTIFMWIPRFAYKETGEIGYIKEETTPGGEWTVSTVFSYAVADETKPDFSLSGVWFEKDVDTEFAEKMAEMKKEEGIYGFLAHTKPRQINSTDINTIQKFAAEMDDLTNPNRIILQIINNKKYEPIKANVIHNTQEQKLEILVTYTSNGISKILDEYGEEMTLTRENGIILAKTKSALASGTYYFTVIDNKGNKEELTITINVDSFYKVAYVDGIDNMDNTATYSKTQEEKSADEEQIISQLIEKDNSLMYSRALSSGENCVTAINEKSRNSNDEELYAYEKNEVYYGIDKYHIETGEEYKWSRTTSTSNYSAGWSKYTFDEKSGIVTLTNPFKVAGSTTGYSRTSSTYGGYTNGSDYTISPGEIFYYVYVFSEKRIQGNYYTTTYVSIPYKTVPEYNYTKGDFDSYIIGYYDSFEDDKADENNEWWYTKGDILPKYTLYKYDQNLTLLSTYDVDKGILTTTPIDISNKGNNKVKLTLNTTGTNYKTYISNDNTNWQEVTDITSGTPKELEVDGWNNLYIKIETNTSTINNIDVAYYKD